MDACTQSPLMCSHITHCRLTNSRSVPVEGTSCSTPVAGQGCGEKAAAEGEGEGASPQRKRQRISRGKGRSNRSVSAWREVKEGRSDAEGSLVAGVPDGVQSSNGQGSWRGNAPVSVPVTCSDAVPSSHGNTMDGSVPSLVVSSNVSPIRSDAGMDLSTSRCDSDSDSGDDDDLPSVSVSFGTPSHNGVACKPCHSQYICIGTDHPPPSPLPSTPLLILFCIDTYLPPSHFL